MDSKSLKQGIDFAHPDFSYSPNTIVRRQLIIDVVVKEEFDLSKPT